MQRVTCIAEIGINHFGDMQLAKEMIDLSKESGADIAKFQIYRPEEILGVDSPYFKEAKKAELSKEQHTELKEYCDSKEIEWCASVFHPDLVSFTENLGIKRYKIASRSVKHLELLQSINETKKPVIMSVGNCIDSDIIKAINTLRDCNDITILYCICNYPTNIRVISLDDMDWLRARYVPSSKRIGPTSGNPGTSSSFARARGVGFSSHCPKIAPSIAAVARRACTIEHHVVKYKTMKGCDVSSSLTFKEFGRLVKYIREIEQIHTFYD